MMLLNCAIDLLKKDLAVLYLDSELNTRLFTARVLAHLSGVEYKRLTSGNYTEEEAAKIDKAREWMKTRKFTHIYIPMFDQQSIYTAVKKVKHTQGLDVLIVDYFKGSGDGDAFDSYFAPAREASPCGKPFSLSLLVTVTLNFLRTLSKDLFVTLFHSIVAVCLSGTT